MIWIAIQCHFGFECIIGEDFAWVCDHAGLSWGDVMAKYVEGMRVEAWNGEKMWVMEHVSFDRVQSVIDSHLATRKIKF